MIVFDSVLDGLILLSVVSDVVEGMGCWVGEVVGVVVGVGVRKGWFSFDRVLGRVCLVVVGSMFRVFIGLVWFVMFGCMMVLLSSDCLRGLLVGVGVFRLKSVFSELLFVFWLLLLLGRLEMRGVGVLVLRFSLRVWVLVEDGVVWVGDGVVIGVKGF